MGAFPPHQDPHAGRPARLDRVGEQSGELGNLSEEAVGRNDLDMGAARQERGRLFTARLAELPEEHAAQLLDALPALEALGQLMRGDSKPATEA